jgi:ectoine hydroxylase-related dioxygenase (phytanoyl-CoA dioxygenase family)
MSIAEIAATDRNRDQELKARYTIDGFASVGRVLGAAALQRLSERFDAICDGEVELPTDTVNFHADLAWGPGTGVSRRDAVWMILAPYANDAVVAEVAADRRILELASLFLGGPARIVTGQFVAKPARHGAVVPWHQDSCYWGDEPRTTCWLAIDDATPENGCMRMIPGSHRQGQRGFAAKRFERIDRELFETSDVAVETQVYVPVPAGCASFHSTHTVHASDANTSAHRRRGMALTYALAGRG